MLLPCRPDRFYKWNVGRAIFPLELLRAFSPPIETIDDFFRLQVQSLPVCRSNQPRHSHKLRLLKSQHSFSPRVPPFQFLLPAKTPKGGWGLLLPHEELNLDERASSSWNLPCFPRGCPLAGMRPSVIFSRGLRYLGPPFFT